MAWFNYNGRGGEGREGEGFLTREHTVRVKLFVLFFGLLSENFPHSNQE
ncbi:hypothetical protein HanXRQr2_Chr16g0753321 [Helianthus annuus]|uniref:Uncharacterized protein n=1 Tax=Helianthus annuus TaxID=4232 RepID=A0A9K3GZ20_HELAN|nr:hypothetical protein HanXRQr2_Chr16g0753321 [Helianthus annuus]